MRVGVSLESLRPGQIGGLEGYVRRLVAGLASSYPELELVLFCAPHNSASFTASESFTRLENLQILELSAEEFAALDARQLARHRLDLWFCPLLVLEPIEPGLPAVVTIPDLQHEIFPNFFSAEILAWRREHYQRTVARADHILTFSNASREMLGSSLGAALDRVSVTYLDSTLDFEQIEDEELAACRARLELEDRYLFYPANNWPHKNHRLLLEALARLAKYDGPSARLLLSGAHVEGGIDLEEMARELGLRNQVRHLGYLPERDLVAVYRCSEATVLPSLFEGFGLPMVEAMRASSPVLASSTTSFPEVGGDAAVYFDPKRADQLAELLRRVYQPNGQESWPAQRRKMVEAGRTRAARFSWTETARTTFDAFRRVLPDRKLTPLVSSLPSSHDRNGQPSIAVITPSLNQAPFVEKTLQSVLAQRYSRLNHLIVDGGSTDSTVEILDRYRLEYPGIVEFTSEKDDGQAAAVNKGFERTDSDIVGWLNSDDLYEPGCLEAIATVFRDDPQCDLVYGRAHYIDATGEVIGTYPTRTTFDWQVLAHECFVCQPTVFIRRRVLDLGHRLNEDLHMCMDYDFWIRLGRDLNVRFLDRTLASSRLHTSAKTISQRSAVYREIFATVKRHYGRLPLSWALGRAHHVWGRSDPFFDARPLQSSTFLVAAALLVGHNVTYPGTWRVTWNEIRHHLAARLNKS